MVASLWGYREPSCLAGKQPKGTFLIKGYSVRMAPYLRKDSKKESCFELTSQDRRSYEVGWAEEMMILICVGVLFHAACELGVLCWVPSFLCYLLTSYQDLLSWHVFTFAMWSLLPPLSCHSHPRYCLWLASAPHHPPVPVSLHRWESCLLEHTIQFLIQHVWFHTFNSHSLYFF